MFIDVEVRFCGDPGRDLGPRLESCLATRVKIKVLDEGSGHGFKTRVRFRDRKSGLESRLGSGFVIGF